MAAKRRKEEIELFYAYLRQNGLKKTYQKELILETFLNTEGHLSVEDVYAQVKKRDKKVGVVTVFRTLKSLTACGIAREITLGDGLTRFEHSYHHPHHHHIICTECHKTIEFASPELERIQMEIISKYHFQPIHHRFQSYGICEDCREHRPVPTLPDQDTERIFARDALRMAIEMVASRVEFYRQASSRNMDSAGRETLRRLASEEEDRRAELNSELGELQGNARGLERAPLFLHFDQCDLEGLLPGLDDYETERDLRLDSKGALEIAMSHHRRAAEYYTAYSEKFHETQGKKLLVRFAEQETKRCEALGKRMEETMAMS